MKCDLLIDNRSVSLTVERDGERLRVQLPSGEARIISARRLPGGLLQIRVEDRDFRAAVAKVGNEIHISFDGNLYAFQFAKEAAAVGSARAATGDLTAPMPGVIAEVMVSVGQTVSAYQPLVAVEAMKVIANVDAPFAGRVTEILVNKGQRVTQGEKLVAVVPEGDKGE